MRINVKECLEEEAAIKTIKSIIYKILLKIGANLENISTSDINIDDQLEFLKSN